MSWLSDFVDGITGKAQADSAEKAAKLSNKTADKYRTEALAELGLSESALRGLMPLLEGMADEAGLDIEDAMSRFFAQSATREGGFFNQFDRGTDSIMSEARKFGRGAEESIEQNFQDTIRNQGAALDADLRRRGYVGGGGTGKAAYTASAIIPNALGGKLNALSDLRSRQATMLTGTQTARAGQRDAAHAGFIGSDLDALRGFLGAKLGTNQTYRDRQFGLAQAPIDLRTNTLVQPQAIYPAKSFAPSISGSAAAGSAFGPSLLSIGSGLLGNAFAGIGQRSAPKLGSGSMAADPYAGIFNY